MGTLQSKMIKMKLIEDPQTSPASASITPASVNELPKLSINSDNLNTPTSSALSPKSQILESKKYELMATQVNTLVAKTWNPNDPSALRTEMREYHSLTNSDYMLPSDDAEQDRLEMQHFIYRAAFQGDIFCPTVKDLAKSPGYKILDVGCAKGFWLKCVKKEYPSAEFHGVDILDQFSETEGINLKFGNVLEKLPYEDNAFDFVHQRLLVLGMLREKYPDALRELIRVTKHGGWIELVEADAVLYNGGPYSQLLSTASFDALHCRGLDCYAALNLPWYVKQVASNVENQNDKLMHLPCGWGSQMGILWGANVRQIFLGVEDWMHLAMGITRENYREMVQGAYAEWAKMKSFAQVRGLYFQVKK